MMEWFLVVSVYACSGGADTDIYLHGNCRLQEVRLQMPSQEVCEEVRRLNSGTPGGECWARRVEPKDNPRAR
jgi:hypothetical protein